MARSTPSGSTVRRSSHTGYAYVLLLIAVAILGGAAATIVSVGAAAARRDAEEQLLAIGAEFHQALRTYRGLPLGAIAGARPPGPRSLDDLLRDPRVPGVRRHLRQIYADPLTGRREWGLVLDPDGTIIGVHSLSEAVPIKQSGFALEWAAFEGARSYRDWVFGVAPAQASPGPPMPTLQPTRTRTSFSPT